MAITLLLQGPMLYLGVSVGASLNNRERRLCPSSKVERHGNVFHRIVLALATLVLCLTAAGSLRAQIAALEGQKVVEVRVMGEAGQPLQENPPGLPLAPGSAYTAEAERESLRKLYATGLYADIRTEVTPLASGLRADFVVRQNYFNGVVKIVGLHEPPSEAKALSALHLTLGETFSETNLNQAFASLQRTLRDDGLYQAKLTRELAPHPETRQMDINVIVTQGPRARLGAIRVVEETEFSQRELLKRGKLKPQQTVTSHLLEHAVERVRNSLVKNGHLGARVVLQRADYDPASNTLPIELDVTAGPKVHVSVSGIRISKGQVRALVPIYEEGSVDADLLNEGMRNIRDYMQRQGYFGSEVNYRVDNNADTGAQEISYHVERGPRRRLARLSFVGNRYFNEDLLDGTVSIRPSGVLSRSIFSPRLLRNDEETIRQLYRSNGFLEAKVTAEVLENQGGKSGDVSARFHIEEGPQTRVEALHIAGNQALPVDKLLSVIGSTAGQPYSQTAVVSDRDNVLALYFNEGFSQAAFQAEVTNAGPQRVILNYRITEGPRVMVKQVLIGGYEHTRPGVIRRRVEIKPGDPLRESDVADTERHLYDLGIFNHVEVAPQDPNGSLQEKTALVNVTESKRYTLGYGGGIELQRLGGTGTNAVGTTFSASPRGILELTKLNVGGRGQTLSFKVRGSTFQYRGLTSFFIPNLLASDKFSLLFTAFADKSRDVRTFDATRYEGSVQVVHTYSRSTTFLYRYFYRHVLVDASSLRIAPQQVPLFSQPTKISGFSATWIHDRRDNAADATRGSFNTADVSVAAVPIGSSASFARLFIQNSTYHPLGRTLVFARSTRFGLERTLAGTTIDQIPLPERFFAGGGTSLRGFALNQAGPRDPVTGFPIGGLAELVFNQEVRFPMHLPFLATQKLGGAVFYDAGNVFSTLSKITLNVSPASPSDLNYFSHTVGFGLRYRTPIGPVRLDLGYQLNAARFSSSCTAGSAGCVGGQLLTRLPRFQFFVNIGSTF